MYLYNQKQDFSNNMYHYLIDTKIIIDDNDTLLIKFQKILLKYKRIIAIILLITLLIIGYLCKIHYLYLNNNKHNYNYHNTCILNGGRKSIYAAKIGAKVSSGASSVKSGIMNMPTHLRNRADDAKELAPWFYGILYSVSIALLSFLIFMPIIGFVIIGLICFVLLKEKISYIKSL